MANLTAREEVLDERRKVLNRQSELWFSNCEGCTLILEAIKRKELPRGTFKDRPNAVCNACPAHHELRDIGKTLESLILKERELRD